MTVGTSLVIPVLNAARTLPACLGAVGRLTPPPGEVLAVDNGSTDDSLALLQAFAGGRPVGTTQVLREPRRGAAAARNAGARVARGDVVAFIDADCEPEPAWMARLLEPFADARVGAAAGRVVSAPAVTLMEHFSALFTLRLPDTPRRHRAWTPWEGGYPTANLAVRRRCLQEVHGFDEDVAIYGEDYDLCARLYARNLEVAYVPEARVAHHHRPTFRGMMRQAFGFGRSHAYLLRRHAPPGVWVDLPWRGAHWTSCPGRTWVDLASADKKVLAMALVSIAYGPLLGLLPLYAAWLVSLTARRSRQTGRPTSLGDACGLAALLLLKSAAMTAGRWWGSVKYGALCL